MADASTDMEYEVQELAQSIDWELLSKQKLQLVGKSLKKEFSKETQEIIDGITMFIDAVQDFFADTENTGVDEDTVFPTVNAPYIYQSVADRTCDICGVENTSDECTNCSDGD